VVPAPVVKFAPSPECKVPQIGWNRVRRAPGRECPLFRGIPDGTYFYFVHSYYLPGAAGWDAGRTTHGVEYASAVWRGRIGRRAVPSGKEPAGGPADAAEFRGLERGVGHGRIHDLAGGGSQGRANACAAPGRADDATVYGDDPAAQAREWARQGATWLHVVDLDGAFQGHPAHLEVIGRMVAAAGIPVECGGGLRTRCGSRGAAGARRERAILGTRALERAWTNWRRWRRNTASGWPWASMRATASCR
jgi:hypothetical protein